MTSRAVETFLSIYPHTTTIPLSDGGKIQMLDSLDDLPTARRYHYAAYIRSEGYLLIWGEDPMALPAKAGEIEQGLMRMLWTNGAAKSYEAEKEASEKVKIVVEAIEVDSLETQTAKPRRRNLQHAVMVGTVLALATIILGLSIRTLIREAAIDGKWMRFALCAILPIMIFFTLVSSRDSDIASCGTQL